MRRAIALVVVLAFPVFGAAQTTWFVPDDSRTIQGAINGSADGDTIIVRPGTYVENITFEGKAITLQSEAGPDVTVIDGNRSESVVTCDNHEGPDSRLVGFSIINGSAFYGGGMHNYESSPTVTRCTFRKNKAKFGGGMYNWSANAIITDCTFCQNEALFDAGPSVEGNGGGIYNANSSLTVTHCTFNENTAVQFGGGIYNSMGAPIITECIFNNNIAGKESGGGVINSECDPVTISSCTFNNNQCEFIGAGICNMSSEVSVTDCTFSENTSNFGGGGIYNFDSESAVSDCLFTKNEAFGWGGYIGFPAGGGGMVNSLGSSEVTDCQFIENEAAWGGGGMYNRACDLTMLRCTFIKNRTPGSTGVMTNETESNTTVDQCVFKENVGSGLDNNRNISTKVNNSIFIRNECSGILNYWDANLIVTNCIFTENEDSGMTNKDALVSVTNCTFTYNKSYGMYNEKHNPTVTNCIFWNNTPKEIKNKWGAAPIVTYSCIKGYPGEGNINVDPLFFDVENNDYHLTWLSPCINRGTNAGAPPEDLDGDPRPSMGTVDMGADEFMGVHTLSAHGFTMSQSAGGTIPLALQAGADYGSHWYCIFGTRSGTVPGETLPGAAATLPVNFDGFTDIVLNGLNTPGFATFLGVLNRMGSGTATLRVRPGTLPPSWVGSSMHFAYAIDAFDLTSNPVEVEITP